MSAPTLIKEVNKLLGQFEGLHLKDQILDSDLFHQEPCISVTSNLDIMTTRCVFAIITGAYELAFPYDNHHLPSRQKGTYRLIKDPFNPQKLTIAKQDPHCTDTKVSTVFLYTLKEFAITYLNYLHLGWDEIPKGEYGKAPRLLEANEILIEKMEHPFLMGGQHIVFNYLADKAQSLIETHSAPMGWGRLGSQRVTRIWGSTPNIERLARAIKKEALALDTASFGSIPLSILSARERVGHSAVETFFPVKHQQLLDKSYQFLEIRPRPEGSFPSFFA